MKFVNNHVVFQDLLFTLAAVVNEPMVMPAHPKRMMVLVSRLLPSHIKWLTLDTPMIDNMTPILLNELPLSSDTVPNMVTAKFFRQSSHYVGINLNNTTILVYLEDLDVTALYKFHHHHTTQIMPIDITKVGWFRTTEFRSKRSHKVPLHIVDENDIVVEILRIDTDEIESTSNCRLHMPRSMYLTTSINGDLWGITLLNIKHETQRVMIVYML